MNDIKLVFNNAKVIYSNITREIKKGIDKHYYILEFKTIKWNEKEQKPIGIKNRIKVVGYIEKETYKYNEFKKDDIIVSGIGVLKIDNKRIKDVWVNDCYILGHIETFNSINDMKNVILDYGVK